MTTKVRIQIVQEHNPVVVEVVGSTGFVSQQQVLEDSSQSFEDYVHSGQRLNVREMTTDEQRARAADKA